MGTPLPSQLDTRLGPLACRSRGDGTPLVFFAGALANGDLWREVIDALGDGYRSVTIDLPLGAHRWPLAPGADRSPVSLGRLLLDCLELLELQNVSVIVNDTAGALLLISLASGHAALQRIDRIVLTNCDSYEHFPPKALRKAVALSRTAPRLARELLRLQLRLPALRRRAIALASARGLDRDRVDSFFGPARRDPRIAHDFIAAQASFAPELLLEASAAISSFARPVLLVWGGACEFFPPAHAQRLAGAFPHARLINVPRAKTWLPIDDPAAVAAAITAFVPARVR